MFDFLMTVAITGGCFGASGFLLGLKTRGLIPLRAPSNKVRIDNAETDVKLAEYALEKRKHELNLEHAEIVGRKKIEEENGSLLALTQVSESTQLTQKADSLYHAVMRFSDRRGMPEFPSYLRSACRDYALLRNLHYDGY